MKNSKVVFLVLALIVGLVYTVPTLAQEKEKSATPTTTAVQEKEKSKTQASSDQSQSSVQAGRKQKISGIIAKRDGNTLVVRDRTKAEYKVNFTNTTKIQERKSNPFRSGKTYDTTALVRGLWVEVEGHGDAGVLSADRIKFTDEQFRDASSLETRVDPVEDRVGETETRVTQAEQNAQRLAGQVEELTAVANTAKGGAKAAQETADRAISEINAAKEQFNQRVNAVDERVNNVDQRLTSVDDYEPKATININFRVGRVNLSTEAKTALDEVATQAKNEKGYVIQVAGFASADGNKEYNRILSERRANAVIRYLIENHDIPQRRIITPYGFGELKPAADNATRDGREQNRRVEVAILVSKGLAAPGTGGEKSRTSSVPQQQ